MQPLSEILKKNETRCIISRSSEETHALGKELGTLLKAGTVLFLTGDLGSGKTAFVQGLARGLGVPDEYYVTSPTYTIINEYPGRVTLYHMDLYRIGDGAELEDLGIEDIMNDQGVIAVEWPDRLPEDFCPVHIRIHISLMDGDSRNFSFTISDMDLNSQI